MFLETILQFFYQHFEGFCRLAKGKFSPLKNQRQDKVFLEKAAKIQILGTDGDKTV